ncbi:MAG: GNAT family N-acetyltransferase [Bacteroidota bacterium]
MLEINFKPFPELSTERLSLRQIRKNDEQEIFILRSDKETMQYIPRPVAVSIEDAGKLIQKMDDLLNKTEAINWAITLRDDPKLIGIIGFYRIAKEHYRGEVGYIMKPQYRGKGIMHEALIKILNFGFNQIKFHCIEAIVDPENTPSSKLLERNGFTKSGYFKEREFFNGKFIDTLYYHLITTIK